MTNNRNVTTQVDFSCELLAFIVLVILSALSHFWYIVIAICIGVLFCGAIILLAQLVRLASRRISRRPLVKRLNHSQSGDSSNQVFQPSKIRQSVDC